MRSRTVLAMVIVVVAVVLAASLILLRRIEVPVEVPSISQEGNITILENGDAQMQLTTTATTAQLDNLYKAALENMGENSFKTMYHQGIENEYQILTGLDVSITDSKIENGPNGELKITTVATASQVGKYNSTEGLWEIDISPLEENGTAAEYMLTQMMFAQMFLKTQQGENQLEFISSIPIKLPGNANILNKDNLSALRWKIDFGGGIYRESSVSVNESQREVILTERIVVTKQKPNLSQARDNFPNYRAFKIKYSLPGSSSNGSTTMSASGGENSKDPKDDFSWNPSWTFSHTFEEPFSGSSDGITANLNVYAKPSFTFTFYVGWDFEYVVFLNWFETYVEINPKLDLDASLDITGGFNRSWDEEIDPPPFRTVVHVYIWPVDIPIEVRLDLEGGVGLDTSGELHAEAGIDASTAFKLGLRWDDGWELIKVKDDNTYRSGPHITGVGAHAEITPYVKLTLGAYFFYSAGPVISLKPNATAEFDTSTNSWSIDAGFDIDAGMGFGTLGDWLDLDDITRSLYSYSTTIASGSWRDGNNPPTLELENAPPSGGTVGSTYTYEVTYQDSDGDAPAYVRCYIDDVPKNMTRISDDYTTGARYRYTWTTTLDDIGAHTYRFEANDDHGGTARLPLNHGTYSGPTLSLPWKAASAGTLHSLGISEDGSLWAWGINTFGHLGIGVGTEYSKIRPVPVDTENDWEAISAGWNHSLGIRSDGSLWAWGYGYHGQLGLGGIGNKWTPNRVDTASWEAVDAGMDHSLGIRSDGTLWAWGGNEYGQLGLGDTIDKLSPVQVGTWDDWVAISAGNNHSLGLRSDGTLWAWGRNGNGQLGLGHTENRLTPTQVGTATNWVAVSAGSHHSLGLRSDGTLWAWGGNSHGQLGLGNTIDNWSPVQVGIWNDWMAISVGGVHSLGIRSDGTLWAWGSNSRGQLGLGDTTNITSPVRVGTATNWEAISAGWQYSLGLHSDKSLWAWGANDWCNQLGLGDPLWIYETADRWRPVPVS